MLFLPEEQEILTSRQIQRRYVAEVDADVILMAKNNVDGVYSADPRVDETATKFEELTHLDVISKVSNGFNNKLIKYG